MLEFIVERDFPIGKNITAFLRINSIFYDVLKDEWLIECLYFFDEDTAQYYRINENINLWINKNPNEINDKNWVWIKSEFLDVDLSRFPLLVEKIKIVSEDFFKFGYGSLISPGEYPVISNEFWYNKTRKEIFEWINEFIQKNIKAFKIKRIIKCIESKSIQDILNPVIEQIRKMRDE